MLALLPYICVHLVNNDSVREGVEELEALLNCTLRVGARAKATTPSTAFRAARGVELRATVDDLLPLKVETEPFIVNQTNIGTVSKATLGKLLRRRRGGWSAYGLSRAIQIPT